MCTCGFSKSRLFVLENGQKVTRDERDNFQRAHETTDPWNGLEHEATFGRGRSAVVVLHQRTAQQSGEGRIPR